MMVGDISTEIVHFHASLARWTSPLKKALLVVKERPGSASFDIMARNHMAF